MLCESLTKCRWWQHCHWHTVCVVWIHSGGIRMLGRGPHTFSEQGPAETKSGPGKRSGLAWFCARADSCVVFNTGPYTVLPDNSIYLYRSAKKVIQWRGKSGSGISNMWEKFAVTHRSGDTAHAKWLHTHCQWYPMGDVRTYNSRTDSRRILKLGGGIEHMTRYAWPLTKVKRSKVKFTRSRNVSAAITI